MNDNKKPPPFESSTALNAYLTQLLSHPEAEVRGRKRAQHFQHCVPAQQAGDLLGMLISGFKLNERMRCDCGGCNESKAWCSRHAQGLQCGQTKDGMSHQQ